MTHIEWSLRSPFVKRNSMHSLIVISTRFDKRAAVVEVLRNCIQLDFLTTNKTRSVKLRIFVYFVLRQLELNAHDTSAWRLAEFHCEILFKRQQAVFERRHVQFSVENFTFFRRRDDDIVHWAMGHYVTRVNGSCDTKEKTIHAKQNRTVAGLYMEA